MQSDISPTLECQVKGHGAMLCVPCGLKYLDQSLRPESRVTVSVSFQVLDRVFLLFLEVPQSVPEEST